MTPVRSVRANHALISELDDLTDGVVFEAADVSNDWMAVRSELEAAFAVSAPAATDPTPVVYIVAE